MTRLLDLMTARATTARMAALPSTCRASLLVGRWAGAFGRVVSAGVWSSFGWWGSGSGQSVAGVRFGHREAIDEGRRVLDGAPWRRVSVCADRLGARAARA